MKDNDIRFFGDPVPKPTAGDITRGAIGRAMKMGLNHSRGRASPDMPVVKEFTRWLQDAAGHEADTRGHDDAESFANGRTMPGWIDRAFMTEQLRRNRYAKTMERRQAKREADQELA